MIEKFIIILILFGVFLVAVGNLPDMLDNVFGLIFMLFGFGILTFFIIRED